MTTSRLSSWRLAAQAARETQTLFVPVLRAAWPMILALHVVQFLANQYFSVALDAIQERGREEIGVLVLLASLEMFFTLLWSAAWILVLSQSASAETRTLLVARVKSAFFVHFNQIVVEQVRALAAVLWRVPLLLIPAFTQYIRLTLVPLVVIFDQGYNAGETDALAQSRSLSRGRFWLLTATLLLSTMIPWFIEEMAKGDDSPWIWENPVGVGLGAVATLFVNSATGLFLIALYRRVSHVPTASFTPEDTGTHGTGTHDIGTQATETKITETQATGNAPHADI